MLNFHESFPDNSGRLQFAPPFPDYVEDVVLAADTLTRLAIPAGARFAVFAFDADVRIKAGASDVSILLPVATSAGGGGTELSPGARRLTLPGGAGTYTHIAFRAATACSGSVSFYA